MWLLYILGSLFSLFAEKRTWKLCFFLSIKQTESYWTLRFVSKQIDVVVGRYYIHPPTKSEWNFCWSISKTYEKSISSKTYIGCIY